MKKVFMTVLLEKKFGRSQWVRCLLFVPLFGCSKACSISAGIFGSHGLPFLFAFSFSLSTLTFLFASLLHSMAELLKFPQLCSTIKFLVFPNISTKSSYHRIGLKDLRWRSRIGTRN